ncbi:MAG: helix-turn-helix transcriptional regulator [Planctomycetota bacterium]
MATKDLVAASSRPLVLSILERGESYGYAIIQEVKALSGGELEWTDGMLYPVLHRLEREGLIKSRWGQSDTGRKRKYYRLSRDGGKALQAEKQQWVNVHNTLAQLWGVPSCKI